MAPGSDAFSSHPRRTWSPCLDHGSLAEPRILHPRTPHRGFEQGDLSFPRRWEIWDLVGGEDGRETGFFQEDSGRTLLSLRKRHGGLALEWWVSQFLAVQISFPWTPHLLLKSTRTLAFLLFSPITLWGSCLMPPLQVGMWVSPVRGQCYQEAVWTV